MDCRRAALIRRAPHAARTLALVALCLPLTVAAASPPTARSYLDAGLRLYKDGQYEAAIRELRLGYALEPLPEILYTLGQSERKLGRCDEAIGYYRQYLRGADASSASAGAARFQIERCEQQLRDAHAAAAATHAAPPPTVVEAPRPPPPPSPPRRPFYKDALGMTLGSVGLGATLAGAGLLIGSTLSVQHARSTLQQFDDTLPRAGTMRTAGIVLTAGGGALLLAGVIRLSLVARHAREGAR
jgi:tetratricopeptide (TPR) repeat protein